MMNKNVDITLASLKENGQLKRLGRGVITKVKTLAKHEVLVFTTGGASVFAIKGNMLTPMWEIDCPAWYGAANDDGSNIAMGTGENIYVWRKADFYQIQDPSRLFALSPDGEMLVTYNKPKIRLWRILSEKNAYSQQAEMDSSVWEVSSLAFSSDGQYLAIGYDGYWDLARIWKVEDRSLSDSSCIFGIESRELTHRSIISAIAFSPDNKLVALADNREILWIWRLEWGRYPQRLLYQINTASYGGSDLWLRRSVAFSPHGKRLALGTPMSTFFCNLGSAEKLQSLYERFSEDPFRGIPASLDFDQTGKLLVVGANKSVRYWNILHRTEIAKMDLEMGRADAIALSPNGIHLAVGNREGVDLIDISNGKQVWHCSGVEYVKSLAFSSDGHMLAFGGSIYNSKKGVLDYMIQVYDVRTKVLVANVPFAETTFLSFNLDGTYLACVVGFHTFVGLLETKNWKWVEQWNTSKHLKVYDKISGITFSNDNKYLVTGNDFGVGFWSIPSGRQVLSLSSVKVKSVAFRKDGLYLAVGSENGWNIWELTERNFLKSPTFRLIMHNKIGQVDSIAFSPDGRYLASGGSTLVLWDLSTGEEKKRFVDITDVSNVVFSPDGDYLISNSDVIRIWRI